MLGATKRRCPLPVAVVCTSVLALSACGTGYSPQAAEQSATPPSTALTTQTINGAIRVADAIAPVTDEMEPDSIGMYPDALPGELCRSSKGYDDVGVGAQVRIATDAGATLALGELGAGVVPSDASPVGRLTQCVFPFTIEAVDLGGGQFFTVEVGNRDPLRMARDEVTDGVDLTLG